MMNYVSASSPKVSIRSTLAAPLPVPANHIEVVRLKHGELVSPHMLSLLQKLMNRNRDLFSLSLSAETLVFRSSVQVNDRKVDYKLVMKVAIDKNEVDKFVSHFYKSPDRNYISTGLLVKAFSRAVHEAVAKNLQYVSVDRVHGPVKSALRHQTLSASCAKVGMRCMHDELTLERVA